MITTERTLLHNTDLAGLMSFPAIQSRVETTRRAVLPKPSIALAHRHGVATRNRTDYELLARHLPNGNNLLPLALWKP